MRPIRMAVLLSVCCVCAIIVGLVGTSIDAFNNSLKPTAPFIGTGFAYDPRDLTPGYPDVATIRLGDRLRIYHAGDKWRPATLALLDERDAVLLSLRLDLPPHGSINGLLPRTTSPCASVRITLAAPICDEDQGLIRIGCEEPELTLERVKLLGLAKLEANNDVARTTKSPMSDAPMCITGSMTNLDRIFGRIIVLHKSGTYVGVADDWGGKPPTDLQWLNPRARAYLDDLRMPQSSAEMRQHGSSSAPSKYAVP